MPEGHFSDEAQKAAFSDKLEPMIEDVAHRLNDLDHISPNREIEAGLVDLLGQKSWREEAFWPAVEETFSGQGWDGGAFVAAMAAHFLEMGTPKMAQSRARRSL